MTSPREHIPSIPLTTDNANGNSSIGGLVRDATAHVSTLVRSEVELAKAEVTSEIKKGVKVSVFFVAALAVLVFSLFFVFLTLGFLGYYFGLSLWVSFLIVTGLMWATAGAFGFLGYRKVKKIRAPQRTISSAKETVAALRHRGEGH